MGGIIGWYGSNLSGAESLGSLESGIAGCFGGNFFWVLENFGFVVGL